MILWEAMRMALASLWSHKVRSLLTILGVVIGIASVLTVVTLGASFEQSIVSQFDSVDQKTIFVTTTVTPANQGPPDCQRFCNVFTQVDRDALGALPGVERVVVSAELPVTSLAWQGRDLTFESLTATVPEADGIRLATDYEEGGPFVQGERQIVLGHQVAMLLAGAPLAGGGQGGPIGVVPAPGDEVEVRFQDGRLVTATVAGVLADDQNLFGDRNGRVFVPVDPFYNVTRSSPSTGQSVRVYSGFTVVATSARDVDAVKGQVESYLRQQSDARLLMVPDQQLLVATASDIQSQISSAFSQVTLFIGAIAVISLVVGAVGIANIMLVAVAERTKEIGVLKAVGAKDREVLAIFMLEAFAIGLVGAVVGILLGLGGGTALVQGVFGDEGVSTVVPYGWIAVSLGVGVGTGVLAGFVPALRATRIQPVQALMRD